MYGENALGIRTHILIVDEFVRTDKDVITRVFDPMLSDGRKPLYLSIKNKDEKLRLYEKEDLKKILLSSIRRADEWSYKTLEDYIGNMTDGSKDYAAIVLPYQLGVRNGFISRKTVENAFKNNESGRELLLAEIFCLYLVTSIANRFNCWKPLRDKLTTA